MTHSPRSLSRAIQNFDELPDTALASLNDAAILAGRSRSTLYRDSKSGLIEFIKVGSSTKIRIGQLRRYIDRVF